MPTQDAVVLEVYRCAAQVAALASEFEHRKPEIEAAITKKFAELKASIDEECDQEIKAAEQKRIGKIAEARSDLENRFGLAGAPWDSPRWAHYVPANIKDEARAVRIGSFAWHGAFNQCEAPAFAPIIGGHNLVIYAQGRGREKARTLMHSIALRLLATMPPGKLRFVFLDPVGLGMTAAGFMSGLPDFLTGGYAWHDARQIEQQLEMLETRIGHNTQKYLGIRFKTMEEYNVHPGNIQEPAYLLVAADFPVRFSDSAASRMARIVKNGPTTGIYTVIMVDRQVEMPRGFRLDELAGNAVRLQLGDDGSIQLGERFDPTFRLDPPAPIHIVEALISRVSSAALEACELKLPFPAPAKEQWWEGDCSTEINVPIGLAHGGVQQNFVLNEKLYSSVLVIGATGIGKSNLLHVLVHQLALKYPPSRLRLNLLDLKQVEFKDYATYLLPHAGVIAVNGKREFALSVLREMGAELDRRKNLFGSATSLGAYLKHGGPPIPRVLLVVDEFQELFAQDDLCGRDAAHILDRLVRQGRAFGLHVLLASQTLSDRSLPTSTRSQIPVRIVLRTSRADSALALSEDNDAAQLLERSGEAIYNVANGRREGNSHFQIYWLPDEERVRYLAELTDFAKTRPERPVQPPHIFEGDEPARLTNNRQLAQLLAAPHWPPPGRSTLVWLGEPMEIKPHTSAVFRRQSRANLILLGQSQYEETAVAMLSVALLGIAAQTSPSAVRFVVLNYADSESLGQALPSALKTTLPHEVVVGGRREMLHFLDTLLAETETRTLALESGIPFQTIYFAILGLHRERRFQREELGYSARGKDEKKELSPAQKLAKLCREGPELGIHTLVWCNTFGSLSRILDRRELDDFGLRVGLQMSADDSRNLLGGDESASSLKPHRALLLDMERESEMQEFRPYSQPSTEFLEHLSVRLKSRASG